MSEPEWYADWKAEAFQELMAKQDVLQTEYGMGHWPRYDYDANAGTLTFSQDGEAKVIADIQIVGTTGSKNWLWGLRNSHWPDAVVADMKQVWQFGLDNHIEELTSDYLEDDDLDALGWEMTAVAVRLLGAAGAYRSPIRDKPNGLYLLIKSARHVT